MFAKIDDLVHRGDRPAAVKQLRHLIRLHPSLQPAYSRLAELTGAAATFQHAAVLAPTSAHAAWAAGHALHREGLLDHASAWLEAAARLAPSGALWSDLGIVLKQAGRQPEALAAYSHAVWLSPAHVQAYNNLGVALQEGGDAHGARRAYAAALQLAPRLSAAVPLNLLRSELDGAQWACAEDQPPSPLAAPPSPYDLGRLPSHQALVAARVARESSAGGRQRSGSLGVARGGVESPRSARLPHG